MRPIKRLIREYVKAILLELGTPAGDQVFIGRTVPTWDEHLPVILLYPSSENIERFDEGPKTYKREFSLTIECNTKGDDDDDLDLKLEELSDRVEALMEIDETLGGIIDRVELRSAEYQAELDGSSPIGSVRLLYNCRFKQNANRSGVYCLPDLKQITNEWEIGHHNDSPDGVTDATDQIDFNE